MCESFYVDDVNTPAVKEHAGAIQVPLRDTKRAIKDLSPDEVLQAREQLESVYGDVRAMAKHGGDDAVRQMLRAIRFWLGPNRDYSQAVDWPVLCMVVPEVRFPLKADPKKDKWHAKVSSVDDWRRWAEAEVNLFRCNLLKVTCGKINLRPEFRLSCAMSRLNRFGKVSRKTLASLLEPVDGKPFACVFFFGPRDGQGQRPCMLKNPFVWPKPLRGRTYGVWLPASEDRMRTRGRFGGMDRFQKRKGLAHEFWHVVTYLLNKELHLKDKAFVPVMDCKETEGQSKKDFDRVKEEVARLGIDLTAETILQEYYAMWPTWWQAQEISKLYVPGCGAS